MEGIASRQKILPVYGPTCVLPPFVVNPLRGRFTVPSFGMSFTQGVSRFGGDFRGGKTPKGFV